MEDQGRSYVRVRPIGPRGLTVGDFVPLVGFPPTTRKEEMTAPNNQMYPEQSQATTALVLGILSIVVCQLLGPFAWQMGVKELQAIDAGRRPPENRSNANAGKILGIIGTVLLALGLLAIIAVFAIGGLAIFAGAANS